MGKVDNAALTAAEPLIQFIHGKLSQSSSIIYALLHKYNPASRLVASMISTGTSSICNFSQLFPYILINSLSL